MTTGAPNRDETLAPSKPRPKKYSIESVGKCTTHSSRSGLLVAGLARHLKGNAIGSGILELEGGGGEMVEILVEEL